MIHIKNLHKFYGEHEARTEVLKGIACEIGKGRICVLLGPSGSGKSTLLNIMGGIESLDSGSVTIGGDALHKMNQHELAYYRRSKLGFVFQFYNLVPNLTVKENIETGSYISKNPLPLDEMIRVLNLEEHKNKFPNQLSGGQQQRCSIGRALIKNPSILLCDEPTGALDYKMSKEILALIEKINQEYKTTVIIVTHNEAIKNMADQIIKLHDGRVQTDCMNEHKTAAKELEW